MVSGTSVQEIAARELADAGVGDAFVLRRDDDGALQVDCAECGHRYGPASRDPRSTR